MNQVSTAFQHANGLFLGQYGPTPLVIYLLDELGVFVFVRNYGM